ncbi:MAG: hypothetical protein V2J11_01710 [Desulfofustis sp.]|nr:hypothetical protein [Desulfofustis sp.]
MYHPVDPPRVLIVYFSLSGQSRGLINLFAAGLRSQGVVVVIEQLQPQNRIGWPFGTILRTLWMMLVTFLRRRTPIHPVSKACFRSFDLVVLAGPTWSYNPSGPILSLLDRYGQRIFSGQRVLPLISCRGYYRYHQWILKRMLNRFTDRVENALVFTHPVREPWSTLGVFLKSAGFRPEKIALLASRYHRFGHTRQQLLSAKAQGKTIGESLRKSRASGR